MAVYYRFTENFLFFAATLKKLVKILVIRFSSIGDIVLTTPVVRALKTQIDGGSIHFATKPKYASILTPNPYIDKIHTLDGRLRDLIGELKRERFDVIIDLHNNLRSNLIRLQLRVKSFGFNKLNWEKWLLVKLKINRLPNVHIVDRYLAAARKLGIKADALGLDFFIEEKDEVEKRWLPHSHQNGYVAVAIGGQHHTKKLPLNRLIELCDRINKPVVLLGGKEDKRTGEQIERFFERPDEDNDEEVVRREGLGKRTLIYNGCGKFNLGQSASLLREATVVFTHDTGLMHIAAAFRKKTYTIWGNTVPEFGMYPYRTAFVIFENKKIDCRPCSKIGFDQCPKGHFKCMNDLIFDFYIPD